MNKYDATKQAESHRRQACNMLTDGLVAYREAQFHSKAAKALFLEKATRLFRAAQLNAGDMGYLAQLADDYHEQAECDLALTDLGECIITGKQQ